MSNAAAVLPVTYADYLALEARSEAKHEFYGGVLFAMAGGTVGHADVQSGLHIALGVLLRGKPCRPRGSDARVYFPAFGDAAYPDAQVVCGRTETHPADPDAAVNPALIAEVLSPSTEAWDRGGKFQRYESLPSVRQILLLSVDAERVESFTRNPDDSWTRRVFTAGAVPLELGGAVALDDIYAIRRAEVAAAAE
jgi:Uma2 family endonuclease